MIIIKFLKAYKDNKLNLNKYSEQQLTNFLNKYPNYGHMLNSLLFYYNNKNKRISCKDYFEQWSEKYKTALKTRKIIKKYTPKFTRYMAKKIKRLDPSVWRKPKGLHNKKRKCIKTKGASPKIGYGKPLLVRNANAKGYKEKICYNLKDMESVVSNTMIKLASGIGARQKFMLEYYADKNKLYIVNRFNWTKYLCLVNLEK
jgi:large subunit ribosomal protein L32e